MTALNNLLLQENLHMAWAKVRRYYITTDAWYDELAVAEFEANLSNNRTLTTVGRDLIGKCQVQPVAMGYTP